MAKSPKYFLVGFLVWIGCCLAQSQDPQSVCVLKDAPNQCGSFCLAALRPIYDKMAMHCTSQAETHKQINQIQMTIANQERDFKGILEKIESTLQDQQTKVQETLFRIYTKVFNLTNFERIGSRYFYIENYGVKDWTAAEESCRQMGAQLATFKNQEEFDAINLKIRNNFWFWVGINKKSEDDKYVAFNNPDPFLRWAKREPNNLESLESCVAIAWSKMFDLRCDQKTGFICVANDSF